MRETDEIAAVVEDARTHRIHLRDENDITLRTFDSRVGTPVVAPLMIIGDDSITNVQGIKEQLAAQNLGLAFPPNLITDIREVERMAADRNHVEGIYFDEEELRSLYVSESLPYCPGDITERAIISQGCDLGEPWPVVHAVRMLLKEVES